MEVWKILLIAFLPMVFVGIVLLVIKINQKRKEALLYEKNFIGLNIADLDH
ncbi:hypothetical protein [Carp edema virus]|nr:hypothetical protein [Carp edema virus]